jgi:hypothetical protein
MFTVSQGLHLRTVLDTRGEVSDYLYTLNEGLLCWTVTQWNKGSRIRRWSVEEFMNGTPGKNLP